MKIAVTGIASLEQFMMSLPLLKGLKDSSQEADIFVVGPEHYVKIKDFCPYISGVIENLKDVRIDKVISLGDICHQNPKFHFADQLLTNLSQEYRRRQIILKDTVEGLNALHAMKEDNFDLVIYPFQSAKALFWEEKNFVQFLTYFFQMNPERKVCIVGFEHQKEVLNKRFFSEIYPQGLMQIEICSLDKMLSLMKRSSHILVADSAIKFLANNEASVIIEVRSEQKNDFFNDCSYKENNFLINLKSQLKNKVVYTYDEIVFDNYSHFLSYLVTSILDEDDEKLRWFADNYDNIVDIYKSRMDSELGLRLFPVYWNPVGILRSLVETAIRLKLLKLNKPHFAEEFYYAIHDESDFSQEQIMFDLGQIQKYLEHLVEFFNTSSEFSKQAKIKNSIPGSLDAAVFGCTQTVDDLITSLFFIRQVMSVSSQKLLENLPMTASYYS